eukprot:tig00001335_g8212.t1
MKSAGSSIDERAHAAGSGADLDAQSDALASVAGSSSGSQRASERDVRSRPETPASDGSARPEGEQKLFRFCFLEHFVSHTDVVSPLGVFDEEKVSLMAKLSTPVVFLAGLAFHAFGQAYTQYKLGYAFGVSGNRPPIAGKTLMLLNFGYQYVVKAFQAGIRRRIEEAVLEEAARVRPWEHLVFGLGALNKAEWLNRGGKDIVDAHGHRLKNVSVVHGDTMTAAAVAERLREVVGKLGLSGARARVFLTGCTSKIGAAVSMAWAVDDGYTILMYTADQGRYDEIVAKAPPRARHLFRRATSLAEGADCPVWVTGKAIPAGEELLGAVPRGAAVVNFAVPDPLTEEVLETRPDVIHIDGGFLGFEPDRTDFGWDALPPGLMFACHAGTVVHAAMGWTHHEVGPVDLAEMRRCWDAALQLGFRLPLATSFTKARPETDARLASARAALAAAPAPAPPSPG